ncbi:MAG TPA: hypothetical protein VIW27_03070 [Gammaproteobacteria bacterium]|jgi:hypothetical protein
MKNIDGIYRVELLGPYGWERFSTAFIDGGEFRSASSEHFTAGSCTADGEGFRMRGRMTRYVDNRALFGRSELRGLPIQFNGVIRDGIIDGEATVVDDARRSLRFRLARLALPDGGGGRRTA